MAIPLIAAIPELTAVSLHLLRTATVSVSRMLARHLTRAASSTAVTDLTHSLKSLLEAEPELADVTRGALSGLRQEVTEIIKAEFISTMSRISDESKANLASLDPIGACNYYRISFNATCSWLITNNQVRNGNAEMLKKFMEYLNTTHDMHVLHVIQVVINNQTPTADKIVDNCDHMLELYADSIVNSLQTGTNNVKTQTLSKVLHLITRSKLNKVIDIYSQLSNQAMLKVIDPFEQMISPYLSKLRAENQLQSLDSWFNSFIGLDSTTLANNVMSEAPVMDNMLIKYLGGRNLINKEIKNNSLNGDLSHTPLIAILSRYLHVLGSEVSSVTSREIITNGIVPRVFLSLQGVNKTEYKDLVPDVSLKFKGRPWVPKKVVDLYETAYLEKHYPKEAAQLARIKASEDKKFSPPPQKSKKNK